MHEFGHNFAHLADEYTRSYPGFPAGDSEPNVTYQTDRQRIPWTDKISLTTDLPTALQSNNSATIGLFEGARYKASGIFRSQLNCRMRVLSWSVPFCEVCNDALHEEMNNYFGLPPQSLLDIPSGIARHFHE